ncbi:glycosyltransferase, partial [Vibrio cholerae]|uniref:glycosyltransferase n=1 Tax=Vibrio cholerae TaxID=666 RepID=UPI0006B97F4F
KFIHTWLRFGEIMRGSLSAKFAGVNNVIWSVHHLDSKCLKGTAKIFSRLSAILSRLLPNSIIYVSEESRDFHVNDGYFAKNAIVVHNFVDTNVYFFSDIRRFEFRKKYNIPNDAFVFGSVARWHPIKGHVTLINAFSLLVQEFPLRDYRLVLVGPGINNYNVELVQRLKEAKIISKVVLIDAHSQLENVYPGLDVHVLASRKEAFGMATLEAIACGITTISTDVGFARKFTSDYKLLFPVDNHHDLFVCMRYASDKENVQERGDFALSDFTLLKAKAKYNNIWAHY